MIKPRLSFWQIIHMNFGFLGLQYSFGLQQANMSPIYSYLGADQTILPLLWLAGPVTGLLIQPLVGVLSDGTQSPWGKRIPYLFTGALISSLCLLLMPYSRSVWTAASILWILNAANNLTQEPYRALVSDKLDKSQFALGFLSQSAFTGLGQTLAYLTPTLLIFFGVNQMSLNANGIPLTTLIAFVAGALVSFLSMLWTMITTPESPSPPTQNKKISFNLSGVQELFLELAASIREMPPVMIRMIPMMLFSWYALFIYWQYITLSLAGSLYTAQAPFTEGFRNAELLTGQIGAFYNFIAFISAFILAGLAGRFTPEWLHLICLLLAGAGLWLLPQMEEIWQIYVCITGLGLCWASIMGNPYIILARNIPRHRTAIYMGIFNMFIVIPMLLETFTMPLYYHQWLGGKAQYAIQLAGVLLILAAISVFLIPAGSRKTPVKSQSDL